MKLADRQSSNQQHREPKQQTIGKKLFGDGDLDAAAKIKAEIEKGNPGVKDLGVKFNEGKVELTGSGMYTFE